MCAFFSFAQAMRFFNHTIMSIYMDMSDEDIAKLDIEAQQAFRSLTPEVVAAMLNRGSFYNSLGIRCYYILFPLVAWIGGGYYLIGATIILIISLRLLDFNVRIKQSRGQLPHETHQVHRMNTADF